MTPQNYIGGEGVFSRVSGCLRDDMNGVDDFIARLPKAEGDCAILQDVWPKRSALMVYLRKISLLRVPSKPSHVLIMDAVCGRRADQEVHDLINDELVPKAHQWVIFPLDGFENRQIPSEERQEAVDVAENDCRVELKIIGHVEPTP